MISELSLWYLQRKDPQETNQIRTLRPQLLKTSTQVGVKITYVRVAIVVTYLKGYCTELNTNKQRLSQ
jgi:hypothetical protein